MFSIEPVKKKDLFFLTGSILTDLLPGLIGGRQGPGLVQCRYIEAVVAPREQEGAEHEEEAAHNLLVEGQGEVLGHQPDVLGKEKQQLNKKV